MGSLYRSTACAAACACALLATIVAGCSGTPTSPSPSPGFSATDVRIGTGAEAIDGLRLTVDYTLWLFDGTEPDQKGIVLETSRGSEPFSFTLGAGGVIAGWDVGLPGIRVGGLRRLVVPPSLAYGGVRQQIIPPFATLIFDIELLSVEEP